MTENAAQQRSGDVTKQKEEVKGSTNPLLYLLAGGVAGAVSRTVAAPFERLKILFQVQDLATERGGIKYTGIVSGLTKIGREEGIMGYFKGNGTNVVRIIPYASVQFLSYEKYKKFFMQRSGSTKLTDLERLAAGGLAGMTSVLASYPLDLVRCRLSAQGTVIKYKGITHALSSIYKEEGFRGWFRGTVPTLMGIIPYVALNFTIYEKLKTGYVGWRNDEPGIIMRLGLGAISGTVAQTITYPLDVVRRRMQMQGFAGHVQEYNGTADAFKKIVQTDGIPGLYKGLISNYLKVVPVVSVTFVVYEYMKKVLNLERSAKEI